MNLELEIGHLQIQRDFYNEAIHLLAQTGYSELTSVIGPIITANETSLRSILLLAEHEHFRDVIILSRPFLECILNVGFICAKGNSAVIDSKKYAYQKGYRDLFREIEVNGFTYQSPYVAHKSEFEKSAPDLMKQSLNDFSKNGREISNWTSETAKQKLELIGKKYGEQVNGFLAFAFFAIYRDISEIIHNSYYGIRIYIGMQQKDTSAFESSDEAAAYFGQHQKKLAALILQQINCSICALLNILSQDFKTKSLEDLYRRSNEQILEYADSRK
jgi:hypothetical protein